MNAVLEDCFVVYSRAAGPNADPPADAEHELVACATYEEACGVRRRLHDFGFLCVIRFVGPTGGGD